MSEKGAVDLNNGSRMSFGLACLTALLFFLSYGFIIPVFPKFIEDLGFTQTVVGVVSGAFWIFVVLTRVGFGDLVDMNGSRRYVVIGIALSTAAYVGYQFAQTLVPLIALRFIHGVGFAAATVALLALAIKSRPGVSSAAAFGTYSIFCFCGYALGPIVGERLANTFGTDSVFVAAALVTVAGLPAALCMEGALLQTSRKYSIGSLALGSFSGIRLNRAHLYLLLLTIPLATAETFVPIFARAYQLGDVGIFFFTFALSMLVSRLAIGRLLRLGGHYPLLFLGACLCFVALLIMSLTYAQSGVIVAACFMGLGWGIFFPAGLGLNLQLFSTNPGRTQALFSCVYDFSFSLGQFSGGFLIYLCGYRISFAITAILSAICALLILPKLLTYRNRSLSEGQATN